ncbi:MAG: hypothetical protein AB7E77_04140, partial [Desulfobulbus sp.]
IISFHFSCISSFPADYKHIQRLHKRKDKQKVKHIRPEKTQSVMNAELLVPRFFQRAWHVPPGWHVP